MSRRKNNFRGRSPLAGGLFCIVSAAVACGSDFNASDCKVTRTCPDPGAAGGEGGEPATPPSLGGGGEGAEGGTSGGEAGVPLAKCTAAADCSNGDPRDGVEACVSGACQPGDAPPRVVSITPQDDDANTEPSAPIVIELSEALDPASVTAESVQLLDGDTPVPGKLSYEDGVVTFAPSAPLRLLASYEVVVNEAVTDAAGVALVEPFRSTFTVRDGAWHSATIPGKVHYLANTAPLSPSGSVLLAWSGNEAESCPVSAGWLELGATTPMTKTLAPSGDTCSKLLLAASGEVGVVSWSADGATHVQQHLSGGWETKATQASPTEQTSVSDVAVSPLGIVTRFERTVRAYGLVAVRTSADGVWQAAREDVAPRSVAVVSEVSVGFDAKGNAFAAFVADELATNKQSIMVSRASAEVGKWGLPEVLPGTETEPNAREDSRVGPAISVAPTGEAMVVWFEEGTRVRTSYYDPEEGWFTPELASGSLILYPAVFPQASVTYDGSQFVTAWIGAPDGEAPRIVTARYTPAEGWSTAEEHRTEEGTVSRENPPLVSDRHGTLLLAWKVASAGGVSLVQRRFVGGAWQPIAPIADSVLPEEARLNSVAMNESGIASVTWPVEDAAHALVAIKVARFH